MPQTKTINKTDFKRVVKNKIDCYLIEDKIAILEQTKKDIPVWINEMIFQLAKNKYFCEKCRKYSDIKKLKQTTKTEISRGQCVYTDAGYGDGDEYADVEYLVTYNICPLCKAESYKSKFYINQYNRHDRYGNR